MTQKAPIHLTAEGKKLWKEIANEIEMDRPAELLLTTLAEQYDRLNQARALLKAEGIVVEGRFQMTRPHPAIAIEAAAITAMTRCWRLLGFDQLPSGEMGRPAGR